MIRVRIEEASVADVRGPVRAVFSGDAYLDDLARATERVAGRATREHGRLRVTVVPNDLVGAVAATGDETLSEQVREALELAITAWRTGAPDLVLADGRHLPTGSRTLVQGVLNVTPDSFSDGGVHFGPDGDVAPAIAAGRALVAAGADLIDVGGESTRPGAAPVDEDEELARTVPVVRALAEEGAVVSIDTTKAAVARAAVDAGAALVNDVSAGALDPQLYPTVAELGVPYVLMHMQGTPRTMQQDPRYDDVVAEVFDHLAAQLEQLSDAGVARDRVVLDPGIGFGKTLEHNLALLRHLRELTSLGRPLLVGASRKTFIGTITGVTDPADRLEGSVAAAVTASLGGARIVRVHDVRETVRSLAVADAVRRGPEPDGGA